MFKLISDIVRFIKLRLITHLNNKYALWKKKPILYLFI